MIERNIRFLKEKVRSLRHSLPFKRIPALMLIRMVMHTVLFMNSFPRKGGLQHAQGYQDASFHLNCHQRYGEIRLHVSRGLVPWLYLWWVNIFKLFSLISTISDYVCYFVIYLIGTNRQGKELFVMAVRSASGDTLPGNMTIIPSGQKWVFHSIYVPHDPENAEIDDESCKI